MLEGEDNVIIDNEVEEKLRYNGESLVPVIVKAIQEQQALIQDQKVLIQSLTTRLTALEAR